MASILNEDNSSYVLTEDMIDAAMTEQQFSFQDDIESEEDEYQDEAMDIDQSPQDCTDRNQLNSLVPGSNKDQAETSESINYNSSILVIETGLNNSTSDNKQAYVNKVTEEENNSKTNIHSSLIEENQHSEQQLKNDIDGTLSNLPILKKMLSANATNGSNQVESIDLCESDESTSDDDRMTEVEKIDDELKSVMENNLMAEIGIRPAVTQSSEDTVTKLPELSKPKISVKNVTQITPNYFNSLPEEEVGSHLQSATSEQPSNSVIENGLPRRNNEVMAKETVPSTIHINKISVPRQPVYNSRLKKMNLFYFRNPPSSLPTAVPSAVKSVSLKYLVAPTTEVITRQSHPITSRPQVPKKIIQALPPKSQLLNNNTINSLKKYKMKLEQNQSFLIKSLLFHNLKKPYTPENSDNEITYPCVDCNDRFLLQNSLNQHLKRWSMLISYWCRICKMEYRFYNRCVFLQHLRGHSISIKHIDTSCITITPITKEMADCCVPTNHLSSSELLAEECILQKTPSTEDNDKQSLIASKLDQNGYIRILPKAGGTSLGLVRTAGSKTMLTTTPSAKIQTSSPSLVNRQLPSTSLVSQPVQKELPPLLSKAKKFTVVKTLQSSKDNSCSSNSIKKAPYVYIPNIPKTFFKHNTPANCSPVTNKLPPNVPYEMVQKKPVTELVDDDSCEPVSNKEEEEIDVENDTGENSSPSNIERINPEIDKPKVVTKVPDNRIIPLKSKSLKRTCSECNTACLNIIRHLNGSQKPSNPKLACSMCLVIMPTKCALQIHQRIHKRIPPYKCPDCGKDFENWNELYSHVRYSCGHLAKCVRHMCTSCKGHFPTAAVLQLHITTNHARDIFKCSSCPVAFFSKKSLENHIQQKHPDDSLPGMDYKQCSMCPKKLVPVEKFSSHVKEHAESNSSLIYGYKCPICSIVFANKTAFIIHQIKEKNERDIKNGLRGKQSMEGKTEYQNTKDNQDSKPRHDPNSDVEEEPEIIREYHEPSDEVAVVPEKDPLSLDDWEYNQEPKVNEKREELCIMCKKNAVILLPGINLNDQSLCCKQCVKPVPLDVVDPILSNGKMLNNNQIISDSLKNNCNLKRKRQIKPKAVQRSSSVDEAVHVQKKRPSDTSQVEGFQEDKKLLNTKFELIPTKKKTPKKANKEKVNNDQSHIQGQIISPKAPKELHCAKCDFLAENRNIFLEHITKHRTDSNSFQCLECGLCFVVRPSLEKHLQIQHGMKDPSAYIKCNKSSLPQKTTSKIEDLNENQCRVCMEEFDSASTLEKHFRTHGMAFMSSLSKSP